MHGPAKTRAGRTSVFAPLAHRAFLWLWVGMVASSIGTSAQTVGAQWLFINDPNAATIVSLVSAANALPALLFALPAGVISDAFDRRRLMIWIQVYSIAAAALLAVLTALGMMPPVLLLVFTFLVGAGGAIQLPTWQPLITELVPRSEIPAATRLDMVNVNVARAVGPAIAGLIIAAWGVPPVFVFNAVSTCVLLGAVLSWRRPPAPATGARERFLPALRAGARYVRHEPTVRRVLVRVVMFIAAATALWALLPLIASRRLGLGATGYGVMFGALGVGAIVGALTLGHVKRRLTSNTILTVAALAYGSAFGLVMLAPGLLAAAPLLVVAGYCWTATVATLNAELQLFLPGWVRARALAFYFMTFTGTQVVASPVWGLVTQHAGLVVAVGTAAGLVIVGGVVGIFLRIPDSEQLERTPLAYWGEAPIEVEPQADAGPIQVQVEYEVPADHLADWLAAMDGMRRSRLRSGASRWELFRVGERPDSYLEIFTVPSWAEHQLQHSVRLTTEDQAIEQRAFSFAVRPPSAQHLLPADGGGGRGRAGL